MLHINTCLSCDPICGFLGVCDDIEHVDSVERVRIEKAKTEVPRIFETQKSRNKTISGDIGLNIRTLASPKEG